MLDIETGRERPLEHMLDMPAMPAGLRPFLASRLDDDLLLVRHVQGRRLLIRLLHHSSGEWWALLDIPIPIGPRSYKGLMLAADAAQAHPPFVGLMTG